jgi:oxygen-dependent protoporphyrinogen oxidase
VKHCKNIIIGGGISGLTTAFELNDSNQEFLLFDKNESSLGGCILSSKIDNISFEHGANTFSLNEALTNLIAKLKIEDSIEYPTISKYKQYIWNTKNHCPSALPKNPFKLLFSDLFNISEKFKIIIGLFKKVSISELDTVSDAFSKIFSKSIVDKSIAPALRGIFGGNADSLIFKQVFPKLYQHLTDEKKSLLNYAKTKISKRKIFKFKNGNNFLIQSIKNILPLNSIIYSGIKEIFFDTEKNVFIVTNSHGEHFSCNNLFITTSGIFTAQFIGNFNKILHDKLCNLEYAPIIAINFIIDKPIKSLSQGFGVLFPKESNSKIIGILCNSNLFPQDALNGKELITICLGSVSNREILKFSKAELINIAQQELREIFSIQNSICIGYYRWEHAIPQLTNISIEINELMNQLEDKYKGLYFFGSDRGKIGVPDRVDYITGRMNAIDLSD